MVNLDDFSIGELEDFIAKVDANANAFAKELYPGQSGSVRTVNILRKYAIERAELLKHEGFGRTEKAKKHEDKCHTIYRILPDYAKWLGKEEE